MSTKHQLLIYLKEGKDTWVSGEYLAHRMAISRTAIWKHIRNLKEDGYIIESSPKKGYLLRQSSDLLLVNEIQEGLTTIIFGKVDIAYFRETDSTNLRAKLLASDGAPEGTVVVAESQTRGRGRRGRSWFSPSGEGIYTSIILRPSISPNEAPKLTLMASVAVAETLLSMTSLKNINIKWPNDILINGRKIAGILTEISMEMDRIDYIVVGVGINVNTPYKSLPLDIQDIATSVLMETGKPFPRIALLRAYLEWLEIYYDTFKTRGFEPIMNRWKSLADIVGHRVSVDMIDRVRVGEVIDIDKDGFLILKEDAGSIERIISGDVTLVNN
ncbi:MAG TPA: biotin--[acetyl-CoA-carboxylase] ligase [Syntrophales bacterium]|nr:biotin--[acetyl-CoA-carboxylase] ligase [Syntrophales bacterium]